MSRDVPYVPQKCPTGFDGTHTWDAYRASKCPAHPFMGSVPSHPARPARPMEPEKRAAPLVVEAIVPIGLYLLSRQRAGS